jgi:NRAMP (natural resistance-associated macrophage protein)-like metal ion transporter
MDKVRGFLRKLGPGIITGAADDDPSGIATYSVAGASFGYGLLWTALFSFPLMTAVQETCGRIGLVTKRGLAEITKEHFPKPVVLIISFILFAANTFNIGADIAGMTAAVRLLIPLPEIVVGISMAGLMTFLIIKMKYDRIVVVFKWLTIALFAYVITFFLVRQNLVEIIRSTVIPTVTFNKDYLLTVLAIFGTTISPYLFFWQTSDEAQNEKLEKKSVSRFSLRVEREDTIVGMLFSNLVMYFIIATVAATLFSAGIRNIGTAAEAAQALRPLAGDAAFLLFAVGIVGTGMLAIPILAGSAGYALAETFGFHEGKLVLVKGILTAQESSTPLKNEKGEYSTGVEGTQFFLENYQLPKVRESSSFVVVSKKIFQIKLPNKFWTNTIILTGKVWIAVKVRNIFIAQEKNTL